MLTQTQVTITPGVSSLVELINYMKALQIDSDWETSSECDSLFSGQQQLRSEERRTSSLVLYIKRGLVYGSRRRFRKRSIKHIRHQMILWKFFTRVVLIKKFLNSSDFDDSDSEYTEDEDTNSERCSFQAEIFRRALSDLSSTEDVCDFLKKTAYYNAILTEISCHHMA